MSRAPRQISLFSDNLDNEMKDIVICIPDGGVRKFGSLPTTYDEGKNGWVEYDIAHKSQKSGLWTIETYKSFMQDGAPTAAQKKTVARNVCFFDALYYCGFSEVSRLGSGQAYFDDGSGVTNFKDAAKQAKQPLDSSGLPQPAAEGYILTDGVFEKDQLDIAEETESVDLVPVSLLQEKALEHDIRETLKSVDVTSMVQSIDATVQKSKNTKQIKARKDDIESVVHNAENGSPRLGYSWREQAEIVRALFKDRPVFTTGGLAAMAVACGGVGVALIGSGAHWLLNGLLSANVPATACALIGAISGMSFFWRLETMLESRANRRRVRAYKKLDNVINAMPDSGLKQILQEFRLTSEANSYFIQAVQRVKSHGYDIKGQVKRAFNDVGKGADILGLPELEKKQLQQKFLNQDFPNKDYFIEDTKKRAAKVVLALKESEEHHLPSAADAQQVKALEHKPELAADEVLGTAKQKVPQPK